jgi:cell division septal protein FtsQ
MPFFGRSKRPSPAARPGGKAAGRPAALRPGARPGGYGRRTKPVRRASAGLAPVRAGAALVLIASIAAIYGLASSDAFAAARTTVEGATWTSTELIEQVMAVPAGQNVFTIKAADLEDRINVIPGIKGSTVTVRLPDEINVVVDERDALIVWKIASRRFLVDAEGTLFAELGEDTPGAAAALPVIDDARGTSATMAVGSVLDPITLDAALRLGSLVPADVGTAARALVLRIDDANGFTMRTRPASWAAVFGFYTPTLRTTDLIAGQARLLRSLLAGREDDVKRVILADDHSGTYVPKETPEPTQKPKKESG